MSKVKQVLWIVGISLGAIVVTGCGGGADVSAAPTTISFETASLHSFVHINGLQEGITKPYITGKMIVLERDSSGKPGVQQELQWSLPEATRAMSDADKDAIGTVVWVKSTKKHIDDYQMTINGRPTGTIVPGYAGTMDVTVVDFRAKKIIARKSFNGPQPASYIQQSSRSSNPSEIFGGWPTQAVATYLNAMPRK